MNLSIDERILLNHACDPWAEATEEDKARIQKYLQHHKSVPTNFPFVGQQRAHFYRQLKEKFCVDSSTLGGYLMAEISKIESGKPLGAQDPCLVVEGVTGNNNSVWPWILLIVLIILLILLWVQLHR